MLVRLYCDASVTRARGRARRSGPWRVMVAWHAEAGDGIFLGRATHDISASPAFARRRDTTLAELLAIELALYGVYCDVRAVEDLVVFSDNDSAISYLRGTSRVRSQAHREAVDRIADAAARAYRSVTWDWVPRRENKVADRLSRRRNESAGPFMRALLPL